MPKTPFLEFLNHHVVLFNGGLGSEIYNRGVFINRNFDELNLSDPKLVKGVYESFVRSGIDALITNTFGANSPKLTKYGLQDQLAEINYKGAKLAREVAGDEIYIAGGIGPLGIPIEPWGPTSVEEARATFAQQMQALIDGGVDLFILEAFEDLGEIREAIKAVRSLCDYPIIASLSVGLEGTLVFGTTPEVYTKKLDEWGADVIGLYCSVGPQPMLTAIEKMAKVTKRPLCAMPDAGLPRNVDGRNLYLASSEYMAEFAARFVKVGCKVVGGGSGVTPAFIKAMKTAIRANSPMLSHEQVNEMYAKPPETDKNLGTLPLPVPREKKSRLAAAMVAGKFVTSVEITPPRGCDATKVLEGAKELQKAGVDAVNIPDGPRAAARMGAMALAAIIEREVGIETVLHYCCRDRNFLGMMSDFLGLYGLGLRNVLIITGDPPKMGDYPNSTGVFDVDSIGLTNMVYRLNQGIDPGGNLIGKPTGWYIGVGCNPGAIDLDRELARLEWKVKAGAEYAVTQPVFDEQQLRTFLDRIAHLKVPIIAGVWPLASLRNAEFMQNEVPGVVVPKPTMERMRAAHAVSPEAAKDEGIKIAQEMVRNIRPWVQGVQVSAPFGRVKLALKVLEALRPTPV